MNNITIKVPATTANLGPGFDSVGCAWNLFNTFQFKIINKGLIIEGCDKEYQNENNLCVVAYKAVIEKLQLKMDNLYINIKSNVPISRGLGSSSTLICAGAFAANYFHGNHLTPLELLHICNKIEGHPDNLAPAIFGGLTASFQENNIPYTVSYNMSEKLNFYAVVPDFHLSTEKARKVLPQSVSFSDAVFNMSRVAILLKSFENGDIKMIEKSLKDKLHQPYRFPLIKDSEKIMEIAKDNGCNALCISGAGSTLLLISNDPTLNFKISNKINALETNWEIIPLTVNRIGVEIIEAK